MEDGTKIVQIKLPDPADTDPHPRLLVDGWAVIIWLWWTNSWTRSPRTIPRCTMKTPF